jgi:hypothetical protein
MRARWFSERLAPWIRGSAWSSRVLVAGVVITAVFTALAVALRVRPIVTEPVYSVVIVVMTAAALKRARFDGGVIAVIVAGLCFYLAYLGYTQYGERNYDAGVQVEYIQYLLEHHARPPASKCLVCHHPPLYYVAGALVYRFFDVTRLCAPTRGLQIFGLLLSLVLVAYAAATAARFTTDRWQARLATAIIVFWPYSVENSVRVHNDSMVSTWMAVALFYAVRWHQDDRPKDLYLASLFTGLAVLTKSSGYVLAAVLFALLFARFFRQFTAGQRLRFCLRAAFAALVLAAAIGLNTLGKGGKPPVTGGPLCQRVLGNACDIRKGQWVANEPFNYVYLDLRAFLQEPYALAERDGSGREFFWNHLLKSSLFGTHNTIPDRETAYEFNRGLASVMNALLLGMLGYLGVAFTFAKRPAVRRYAVLLCLLVASLALMVGFRAIIPAPHHTDFRHVYPLVIPMAIVYAAAVGYFRRREMALEHVGHALVIPFLLLSIVYFFPKHDFVIRWTTHVVERDLALYSKPVPEGTPWDKETNLLIEENHIVEFAVPSRPTVKEIDVTLDNNDVYEIELVGDGAPRKLLLGPSGRKMQGLMRYVQAVDPSVARVRTIHVRPVRGDMSYALGHLILK